MRRSNHTALVLLSGIAAAALGCGGANSGGVSDGSADQKGLESGPGTDGGGGSGDTGPSVDGGTGGPAGDGQPSDGTSGPSTDAPSTDGGGVPETGASSYDGGVVRVMPLGDSITAATCWRARLWDKLQAGHYTNVTFVGTQDSSGNCSNTKYDGKNEGHSGMLVTTEANMEPNGPMDTWFQSDRADLVLMHFGTNDVWNGIAPAKILAAYSTVIDTLRIHNPKVRVIVAQILPMAPSGCTGCPAGAQGLNAQIPAWASSKSTAASPISVVDQWTGFSDATDTADGVHPNDTTGSQKIADKWYPALVAAL